VIVALVGFALLFAGGGTFVFLVVVSTGRIEEVEDHRRIVRTPTTPIARTPGGGMVALHGRAVASEQGHTVSPVSRRPALVFRVNVAALYLGHKRSSYHQVYTEKDRREFWLDDGSGERAWPNGAGMYVPVVEYGHGGIVIGGMPSRDMELTSAIEAWARQKSGEAHAKIRVEEHLITPGDALFVCGYGYRHNGVLVMCNQPGNQLLLSTFSEAQLLDLYAKFVTRRKVLILVVGAVAIIGLLMIVSAFI